MDNRTHYNQCAIELVENSMEKVEVEGNIVKDWIFRYLGGKGIKIVRAIKIGVGTWMKSFSFLE
ncbi:MAG: hypothetical protein NZ531_02630 [Aquificaceae bacterium]|nr:hypothetical protein [Aquificaceae bacterium]